MGLVLDAEGAHLASLRRLFNFRQLRVLEIGCGDGRLTAGMAADAASVVAFDPSARLVETAERRLQAEVRRGCLRLLVASAVDAPLPRAGFDVAVFSWSY